MVVVSILTKVIRIRYAPLNNEESRCLVLMEDQSYVVYYNVESMFGSCPSARGTVQIDNSFSTKESILSMTFQVATQLYIENERLHDWRDAKGNLGLAYCGLQGCGNVWALITTRRSTGRPTRCLLSKC